MDIANRVQTLDGTVYISHSANTLGKGINPIILPPAMKKYWWQTGLFNLGMATRRKTLNSNLLNSVRNLTLSHIVLKVDTPQPGVGLRTLTKELTVANRVIQSFSKELSTSFSDSVKCKQKEVNTYALNSLACIGSVAGYGVILSGDVKLAGFRSQLEVSRVSSYPEELWCNETVGLWMTIYIYTNIWFQVRNNNL